LSDSYGWIAAMWVKSAFNAIKGITMGVAGNKITDLIDKGLEIIKNL